MEKNLNIKKWAISFILLGVFFLIINIVSIHLNSVYYHLPFTKYLMYFPAIFIAPIYVIMFNTIGRIADWSFVDFKLIKISISILIMFILVQYHFVVSAFISMPYLLNKSKVMSVQSLLLFFLYFLFAFVPYYFFK